MKNERISIKNKSTVFQFTHRNLNPETPSFQICKGSFNAYFELDKRAIKMFITKVASRLLCDIAREMYKLRRQQRDILEMLSLVNESYSRPVEI